MENLMSKDKNIAGLLALFLGWMGAHWIYLGHRGLSVFYITVSLLSIGSGFWFMLVPFALLEMITGINYFRTNWNTFNSKYNRDESI